MDGGEVCKQVKADDELKNISVILLSASSSGDISAKAKEIKADDYIVKPFDVQDLLNRVGKFLEAPGGVNYSGRSCNCLPLLREVKKDGRK